MCFLQIKFLSSPLPPITLPFPKQHPLPLQVALGRGGNLEGGVRGVAAYLGWGKLPHPSSPLTLLQ